MSKRIVRIKGKQTRPTIFWDPTITQLQPPLTKAAKVKLAAAVNQVRMLTRKQTTR
jgi:hypothetical protein